MFWYSRRMSRTIDYDPDHVVRKASALFWRHGYQQTGVRDLLAATGCNRRGLYERFGGKQGLFALALDHYCERYIDPIVTLLNGPKAGFAALHELFELRIGARPQLGCLVLNTVNEKPGLDRHLYRLAREQQARIQAGVHHCLNLEQQAGRISPGQDLAALTAQVMTLLHGMTPSSRGGISPDELRSMAGQALAAMRTGHA
jgi:AcrR family transcriptional regulator